MEQTKHLALVTGGSRGIGAAIAVRLAQRGFSVAIVYKQNTAAVKAVVSDIRGRGGDAHAFACDIADAAAVNTLLAEVKAHFSRMPDVLINNAGVAHAGVLADMTDDDYNAMFDTNMRGIFHLCRGVYDAMVQNRWGRIVNVSSMWGIAGASCEVLYSASKAAVIGFTKALALELAPSGITVNAIAPGAIATDMLSCYDKETLDALAMETPVRRLGAPDDIAAAVEYLVSEDASFVTGQVLSVNGGYIT